MQKRPSGGPLGGDSVLSIIDAIASASHLIATQAVST